MSINPEIQLPTILPVELNQPQKVPNHSLAIENPAETESREVTIEIKQLEKLSKEMVQNTLNNPTEQMQKKLAMASTLVKVGYFAFGAMCQFLAAVYTDDNLGNKYDSANENKTLRLSLYFANLVMIRSNYQQEKHPLARLGWGFVGSIFAALASTTALVQKDQFGQTLLLASLFELGLVFKEITKYAATKGYAGKKFMLAVDTAMTASVAAITRVWDNPIGKIIFANIYSQEKSKSNKFIASKMSGQEQPKKFIDKLLSGKMPGTFLVLSTLKDLIIDLSCSAIPRANNYLNPYVGLATAGGVFNNAITFWKVKGDKEKGNPIRKNLAKVLEMIGKPEGDTKKAKVNLDILNALIHTLNDEFKAARKNLEDILSQIDSVITIDSDLINKKIDESKNIASSFDLEEQKALREHLPMLDVSSRALKKAAQDGNVKEAKMLLANITNTVNYSKLSKQSKNRLKPILNEMKAHLDQTETKRIKTRDYITKSIVMTDKAISEVAKSQVKEKKKTSKTIKEVFKNTVKAVKSGVISAALAPFSVGVIKASEAVNHGPSPAMEIATHASLLGISKMVYNTAQKALKSLAWQAVTAATQLGCLVLLDSAVHGREPSLEVFKESEFAIMTGVCTLATLNAMRKHWAPKGYQFQRELDATQQLLETYCE